MLTAYPENKAVPSRLEPIAVLSFNRAYVGYREEAWMRKGPHVVRVVEPDEWSKEEVMDAFDRGLRVAKRCAQPFSLKEGVTRGVLFASPKGSAMELVVRALPVFQEAAAPKCVDGHDGLAKLLGVPNVVDKYDSTDFDGDEDAEAHAWNAYCSAVEKVATFLLEKHDIELEDRGRRGYGLRPVSTWRKALEKLRSTINGAGPFYFHSVEALREGESEMKAFLEHLHWVKQWPLVYGYGNVTHLINKEMK